MKLFPVTVFYTGPGRDKQKLEIWVKQLLQDKFEQGFVDPEKAQLLYCHATEEGDVTVGPFPNGLNKEPDFFNKKWQFTLYQPILSFYLPLQPGMVPISDLWQIQAVKEEEKEKEEGQKKATVCTDREEE